MASFCELSLPVSQDTPARLKKVAGINYRSNHLAAAREAVIEDLGPWIPQVKLGYILKHIIKCDSIDVEGTMNNLLDAGHLSLKAGWTEILTVPSQSLESEVKTFATMKDIRKQLVKHTSFKEGQQTPTLVYESNPNRTVGSTRYNSTRPDGYGRLDEANPLSTVASSLQQFTKDAPKNDWLDIGYAEEYKKSNTASDQSDNIQKILWNMQHIMRNDPRRRYTFGVTIEDTQTRLWFCSRQAVIVSKPFDFMQKPTKFIKLFTALTFSSPTQLGWDPTVKLVKGPGTNPSNIWSYEIEVHSKTPSGNISVSNYRTEDTLSDFSADALRGRATRVFKARMLDKDKITVGEPVALKDVWQDYNRRNEAEILEEILDDASAEEKKYFLTIITHGSVIINDQEDHTLNHILNNEQFFYYDPSVTLPPPNTVFIFPPKDREANPAGFDPSKSHLNSLGSHVKPSLTTTMRARQSAHYKFHHKIHMRFVYKEVCEPLYKICSAKQLFLALNHAIKGLEIMTKRNWVHRDISPGNILMIDGQGKLSDLEYAIKIGTGGQHNVRTGTVDFMAIEVLAGKYLFLKPPAGKPRFGQLPHRPLFSHNPLHDVESILWVALWSLLWSGLPPVDGTFPQTPRQVETQIDLAQRLFSQSLYHEIRSQFLKEEIEFQNLANVLPEALFDYGAVLQDVRLILLDAYLNHSVETDDSNGAWIGVYTDIKELFESFKGADCALYPLERINNKLNPKRPLESSDLQHAAKRQELGDVFKQS